MGANLFDGNLKIRWQLMFYDVVIYVLVIAFIFTTYGIEKLLKIDLQTDRYSEAFVVMCFVVINYLDIKYAMFVYLIIYSLYMTLNIKNISYIVDILRNKV